MTAPEPANPGQPRPPAASDISQTAATPSPRPADGTNHSAGSGHTLIAPASTGEILLPPLAAPPLDAPPIAEGLGAHSAVAGEVTVPGAHSAVADEVTAPGTALAAPHAPAAPPLAEEPPVDPGPESVPLIPDAILPPGTAPQPAIDPDEAPTATTTMPPPDQHGPGPFPPPGGPGMPPGPPYRRTGSPGARRALIIGGALGVMLLGGGALAYSTLAGPAKEKRHAAPPPPTTVLISPSPSPTPKPSKKPKSKPTPVDIRDEKKDGRQLTLGEVFPGRSITAAGKKLIATKTVINDRCDLTARGPFAEELTRQHCRRVVRATFVDKDKKVAVTTGIAVMPTDAAAAAVLKAQDPGKYEWFRGMKAPDAPKIDQAGGFAASTRRGRYIPYAYATYADGHKPKADDKALKTLANAVRDITTRPITKRDHSKSSD